MARSDVVARANKLLRIVGKEGFINVEELKRSACSMFVYLFERLFDYQLEGVIRRPTVKADYIHNAETVLLALSGLAHQNLDDISASQIANGNVEHISHLLEEFERETVDEEDGGEDNLGQDDAFLGSGHRLQVEDEDEDEPQYFYGDDDIQTDEEDERYQPRYGGEQLDDDDALTDDEYTERHVYRDDEFSEDVGGGLHGYYEDEGPDADLGHEDDAGEDDDAMPEYSTQKAGQADVLSGDEDSDYSEGVYRRNYYRTTEGGRAPVAYSDPSSLSSSEPSVGSFDGASSENQYNNDENGGSDGWEDMVRRFPQNPEMSRRHRQLDAIRALATHRTQNRDLNEYSAQLQQQKERDKGRFRKAYQDILDDERRQDRLREQRRRLVTRMELKRQEHEKRVEQARIRRLAEDLGREAASRRFLRKEKEDALVRSMFNDALATEKERVLRTTAAAAEDKARQDKQALMRYEAQKKVYEDQKDILDERVKEQEKADAVQKRNRQEHLRRLSKELKQEFEQKLRNARVALDAQEEKVFQVNAQVIERAFSILNDTRANLYDALVSSVS